MKQNRKLVELQNIGKKIAARLNEVGIFSEDELRVIGSAQTQIRGGPRPAGSDQANYLKCRDNGDKKKLFITLESCFW